MLNGLLKLWVRLALPFFAVRIDISGRERLASEGPLLLAVNHPNSFLDAVLLGAFMRHPVHYLARGDVFRKKWIRTILSRMNMLPVYRMRDGKHKLSLNDQTFERSREVLMNNGILLVFVEGFCEHQTTLQLPLKKGAPRVVEACWRQGVPVQILPVWLQYNSFTRYPKHIEIRLGEVLPPPATGTLPEPAVVWQRINEQTAAALKKLEAGQSALSVRLHPLLQILLALPALLGAVLHAPLYLPVKAVVRYLTRGSVHLDSVLLAVLLLLYPLYLLVLALGMATAAGWEWGLLPLAGLPLLARAYVVWRAGME